MDSKSSLLRLQGWRVGGSRKKGKGNVLGGVGRAGREGQLMESSKEHLL